MELEAADEAIVEAILLGNNASLKTPVPWLGMVLNLLLCRKKSRPNGGRKAACACHHHWYYIARGFDRYTITIRSRETSKVWSLNEVKKAMHYAPEIFKM